MVFGLFKKRKLKKAFDNSLGTELKPDVLERTSYGHGYEHERGHGAEHTVLNRAFNSGIETSFGNTNNNIDTNIQSDITRSAPTNSLSREDFERRFQGFLPKQERPEQQASYSKFVRSPQEQESLSLLHKEIEILSTKIDSLKANIELINTRLKNIEQNLKNSSW